MAEQTGALTTNGTASALIRTGKGRFYGVSVNSHSSGTLKFWDNTEASGTVLLNTITLAAGPQVISLPEPLAFETGLYLTKGGTVDYTVIYR